MLQALKARNHWLAVATGKSRAGLNEALDSAQLHGVVRRHAHRRRDRLQARPADAAGADARAGRRARAHADDRRHHARPAARRQRRRGLRRRELRRAPAARTSTASRPCSSRIPRASCTTGCSNMPERAGRTPRREHLCASDELAERGQALVFDVLQYRRAGARLRAALRRPRGRLPEPLRARADRDGLAAGRVSRQRQAFHPVLDPRRGLRAAERPLRRRPLRPRPADGRSQVEERDGQVYWYPSRDIRPVAIRCAGPRGRHA